MRGGPEALGVVEIRMKNDDEKGGGSGIISHRSYRPKIGSAAIDNQYSVIDLEPTPKPGGEATPEGVDGVGKPEEGEMYPIDDPADQKHGFHGREMTDPSEKKTAGGFK